ncbi:hypothetical protein ABH926_009982 [Catenulispora sp. GP43]
MAKVAEVTFTNSDRVRDVIRSFNADGFDSLHGNSRTDSTKPRRSRPSRPPRHHPE